METCNRPLSRAKPHMWLFMPLRVYVRLLFFHSVTRKRSIVFLIPHLIILVHAFRWSHGPLNTPLTAAHGSVRSYTLALLLIHQTATHFLPLFPYIDL